MGLSLDLRSELDELVKSHRVLLFMKGTRGAPQCGFSASVVELLDGLIDDYFTVDVLARPDVRQGVKEYSDWPTIPQLYVDGDFVGGADIVREMYEAGELHQVLGCDPNKRVEGRASPLVGGVPAVTLTDAAAKAVVDARQDDDAETLRFEISGDLEHALYFDDKRPGDIELEVSGLTLILDPDSARRANGAHVDYVKEGEREGFKIDNPNKKEGAKPSTTSAPTAPPRPENPPVFTVTEAAFDMFHTALAEEEGEGNGIQVGARRMGANKVDYELAVIAPAERREDDFEVVQDNVPFWVDPMSARHLDGATIDFVDADGASGFKFSNERIEKEGWGDPRAEELQKLLEDEINPSIASHGGVVELLDFIADNAYVLMGGGCQGCGMAAVTLQQGIQERVNALMPGVRLVDTTDHSAGSNPYYQSGK
jgi:Grx4 family monothiol glutaredoxin